MTEEEIMKKLLENENYDGSESLRFFRDRGLVDYHEYTAYTYETRYGDYIGNDEIDDCDDLVEQIVVDQNFDEFMEEFIDYYVDEDLQEQFSEEGLTKKEIAMRLLNK